MPRLQTIIFDPEKNLDEDKAVALTVNTTEAAEIIKTTFLLSMHGGFTLSQRAILNTVGTRMRDQLRRLLGEIFDQNTDELEEANDNIRDVNEILKVAKQDLDKFADAIEGIGKLIASFDKLLGIVGKVL